MPMKGDVQETHDQRNDNRQHQRHRHAVRAARKKRPSRSSEHVRSPARSCKRDDLTLISNSTDIPFLYDDLFPNEVDHDSECDAYYYDRFEVPASLRIRSAIDTKDADLLSLLIKQHHINQHLMRPRPHPYPARRRRLWRRFRTYTRQPHTMLTYAIERGDSECVDVLLDGIVSGYIYPTIVDHVGSTGKTALWYACEKGDLSLVRELVEFARATINKCGVLIVAVQNGHKDVIDYLLRKGCDPNRRAKNYNERALHVAVRRNRLDLVCLLLQYGADPSVLDYKKRTPLDYAIHKRYTDVAKVLIEHHHGRFIMSQTGFTPLMLATDCGNTRVADILSSILPEQQILDELVLLACRYTIDGNMSKRDLAYCYFEKALSKAVPQCLGTPCEAYEFLSECQTLDELASIRDDDNKLRLYALLTAERLLMRRGEVRHLLSLILKQCDFYRWQGLPDRCLQLRIHAYRIFIQTENKDRPDIKLHGEYLKEMVNVLYKILKEEDTVPVHSLAFIWSWILDRIDKKLVRLLFKLLFIVIYIIERKKLSSNEQCILWNVVRRAVSSNLLVNDVEPLLNHFIRSGEQNRQIHTCLDTTISTMSIVRLLIHAGADVNAVDLPTKSTPLHLAAWYWSFGVARPLVQLLLDANAHTDSVDRFGRKARDRTYNSQIAALLQASGKLSLKCRCAHLIVSNKVAYRTSLPRHLIRFVQMHSTDSSQD